MRRGALIPGIALPGIGLTLLILGLFPGSKDLENVDTDWPAYLGGPDRNHYSSLSLINKENVHQLKKVWEYHTYDSGQIQCNPIIIDGILYGMTASTQPFALDAASGKELWRSYPDEQTGSISTSRGLVYWAEGNDKRILYTHDAFLYALHAETGQAVASFGDNGRVSLKAGLGESARDKLVISNTPGAVFEDLIMMPLRLSEGADAAPGYIQAFNIRNGALAWVFKTIPSPEDTAYSTWPPHAYLNVEVGAANNWAGMAVDRERGIVYVPTGSAAFDFYGGNRKGANLYANTLLALNARTGEKIWHYQLVHHDILDRDPPAPPNLLTVSHDGKKIDAVAQVTKQGYVFLFDRESGEPLFPIEEIAVPASDVAGEEAWPTQPRPLLPLPYARQQLTEEDISPYAANREELLQQFRELRSEGPFTPLAKGAGSLVFPGLDGGAEWGGAAVDPEGIMYLNSSEMAWILALDESATFLPEDMPLGEKLYATNCAACHGAGREGNISSGFPSLQNLDEKQTSEETARIISNGKGMMPAFTRLTDQEKDALLAFLYEKEKLQKKEPGLQSSPENLLPYRISRFSKFLDQDGFPGFSPPWGTLNAIDLNTGEYLWKIPYGEYPELMAKGIPPTGAESYGGPIVTASGLLFIAGTKDRKFRAYDKNDGALLWETLLPAAGFATPSTYSVNGQQYVVIACGGGKLGAPKGESYVAFALPSEE